MKFLKTLFAIEVILILVVIALSLTDNERMPTAYVVKENPDVEKTNFKILTKAVCEEKSEHISCHDELFIKCNEKEFIVTSGNLENFTMCNNTKLNLSYIKVNGTALFKKEWVDPRKSE